MEQPNFTTASGPSGERRPCYAPNRSCENCRLSKVRCLPGDPEVTSKCERCFKVDKDCVHALPTKRKPRKKTESKVAELQREVRALSFMLRRQQGQSVEQTTVQGKKMQLEDHQSSSLDLGAPTKLGLETSWSAHDEAPNRPTTVTQPHVVQTPSTSTELMTPHAASTPTSEGVPDTSDSAKGKDLNLSVPLAEEIFRRFKTELLADFPIVHFPPETTAADLKASRPALFLALQTAGAGVFDEDLTRTLHEQLMSFLAEEIVINGAKSLDHLQCLLIATIWNYPPDRFEQLKYVQFSAIAAGIAMELKIAPIKRGQPPELSQNENSLEIRRTLVAAYILCAGVSYHHGLPSVLPFVGRLSESVDYLESSTYAFPSDRRLCILARLQRIMEESSTSIDADSVNAEVEFNTPRVQLLLKSFDRQILKIQAELPPPQSNPMLEIIVHAARTHLYEVSMHSNRNGDDFRPPFTVERITKRYPIKWNLSPAHIDAMLICLSSSHAALETFLNADAKALRGSPTVIFIRVMYSIVIMLKLFAATNDSTNPLAKLLDSESIQVPQYLERVHVHLQAIGEGGKCRIANKFTFNLVALRRWFSAKEKNPEDLIEPLRHLDVNLGQDISPHTQPSSDTTTVGGLKDVEFYPHYGKGWGDNYPSRALNSQPGLLTDPENATYHHGTFMNDIFNVNDLFSVFAGQEQFDPTLFPLDDSLAMSGLYSFENHSSS